MYFDDFSADMLNGDAFDHTTVDYSDNGSLSGRHTFYDNGNHVNHFDDHGHMTGHSDHFGNHVNHYDTVGHLTGTSQMLGNQLIHRDNLGHTTGYDRQVGTNTMHYDSLGRVIGRTDAFGNEFDAMGRRIGWKH